jgi:hypothetical protein
MEHNECETCGANDGRAGLLINGECLNCHETRKTGEIKVYASLQRTDKEMAILFGIVSPGGE